MKRTLCINKKAKVMFVPQEMIEDGWDGEVNAFLDALTVTIIKPGTSLKDVLRSIDIVKQDIQLRIEAEKKGRDKNGGSSSE